MRNRYREHRVRRATADGARKGARFRTAVCGDVRALAQAIQRQLGGWRLTPAESRVAFLLLRGLPPGDVAALLRLPERAVRHTARVIYAKAGVRGQAALSTYFLDDLYPLPSRR